MADARLQKQLGVGRHLSAIKRHRQSLKRNARNKAIKSATKTEIKKARRAIAEGNREAVQKQLQETISALQRAATKGVIPKKRASRLSSRLSRAANASS